MWAITTDPRSGKSYWYRGSETTWEPPVSAETVCLDYGVGRCSDAELGAILEVFNGRIRQLFGWEEASDLESVLKCVRGLGSAALRDLWDGSSGSFVVSPRLLPGMEHARRLEFAGGVWYGLVSEADASRRDVVSVSVFRFAGEYRETHKYARGLEHLSRAVKEHLPSFKLRIFTDDSTVNIPEGSSARDVWAHTWSRLDGEEHVERVMFACSGARSAEGVGHVDLFGTMVRFAPLFYRGGVLGVEEGGTVFVSDVDFKDLGGEHVFLHVAEWYSAHGDTDMCCVSSGGSVAPRHLPRLGEMPSMIANCVMAKRCWPREWWEGFLEDAMGPDSVLARRYVEAVHSVEHRASVYDRRNIANHRSTFPFGVDEYFLSLLVANASLSEVKSSWLFLILPPPDRILSSILNPLARTSSPSPDLIRTCSFGPEDLATGRKEWPDRAAATLGLRWCDSYAGGPFQAASPEAEELKTRLTHALSLAIDAASHSGIDHTVLETELWHFHLSMLAHEPARGILSAPLFHLGNGNIQTAPSHPPHAGHRLLETLSSHNASCDVKPPSQAGTKRPRP